MHVLSEFVLTIMMLKHIMNWWSQFPKYVWANQCFVNKETFHIDNAHRLAVLTVIMNMNCLVAWYLSQCCIWYRLAVVGGKLTSIGWLLNVAWPRGQKYRALYIHTFYRLLVTSTPCVEILECCRIYVNAVNKQCTRNYRYSRCTSFSTRQCCCGACLN